MSDYTVSDLARKLKRSRSSITALILSGRLEAYDAAPEGRRRQWRVTPESLERFTDQNRPQQKRPRRRVKLAKKQYV